MTTITISDQDYKEFCRFLESQCGIVLGDSKQYLVRSRLSPLVTKYRYESLSALLKEVISGRNRDLRIAVVDAMTTNGTLWFRDTYPFVVLAEKILPELAAGRRPLKIWSAASSSGQEPYSLAMTISAFFKVVVTTCLIIKQLLFLDSDEPFQSVHSS